MFGRLGGVLSRFLVVLEGPRGVLRGLLGVLTGLGPLLGDLGSLMGRSWPVLGGSWLVLGRSWLVLGRSCPLLGRSRACLVGVLGPLGVSRAVFGRPGAPSERSRGALGTPWGGLISI